MAYYNEVSVAIVNIDEDITNNENHLPHYYTLQGQQVTAPHKGLYIRNGRKMLIK